MFSQKGGKSPLAEKRVIYSSIKRGIFGRRCYSESIFLKKRVGLHEDHERSSSLRMYPLVPILEMLELGQMPSAQVH